MSPRFFRAFFLVIPMAFFSTAVFAGKVELTTYYPTPNAEYSTLQTSSALKIPVKPTLTNTAGLIKGEIWLECLPPKNWNGTACV